MPETTIVEKLCKNTLQRRRDLFYEHCFSNAGGFEQTAHINSLSTGTEVRNLYINICLDFLDYIL